MNDYEKARKYFDEGIKHFNEGNYDKAIKEYIKTCAIYGNLDTENLSGEDLISDSISLSVEEQVSHKILCDEINDCIYRLCKSDQEVIHALFFSCFTERQYADLKDVSQDAINKEKKEILNKMKIFYLQKNRV